MSLIDNTTWSGKNAQGFYSDALLVGSTKSLFRKELAVKSVVNVSSLNLGSFLQPDACKLVEQGNYTLAQKPLEVCPIGFRIPFCTLDWERNYLSESLAAGANNNPNFPTEAIDYIFMKIKEGISEQTEYLTFQGDTAASPADLCDGLEKQLLADGTVIDVAADGTKIEEAATVIGELTRIYEKIPKTVRKKVSIFVNITTDAAYRLALSSATGNPALLAINGDVATTTFAGVPVIVAPGLGDAKAICADPMNLVWGTDLESDEMEISFIQDPTNPKTSYAIGSFKFGVMHLVGKEIVYYN